MKIATHLSVYLLALTLFIPNTLRSEEVSEMDIQNASLNLQCLDYQVKGICVWLFCTMFGCTTKTSLRVSHFNPDVLIESAKNQTSASPIIQPIKDAAVSALSGLWGEDLGGLTSNAKSNSAKRSSLQFSDVDVFGNTGLLSQQNLYSRTFGRIGFCKSKVTSLRPYYMSEADPEWRWGIWERISAMYRMATLDFPTIGSRQSNFWGNLLPRMGYVKQLSTYKAAAVNVTKVADLIAGGGDTGLHIYTELPNGVKGSYLGQSEDFKTGDMNIAKFQLLAPSDKGDDCYVFPEGATTHYSSDEHNYLWILWRNYWCCKIKGMFLYMI